MFLSHWALNIETSLCEATSFVLCTFVNGAVQNKDHVQVLHVPLEHEKYKRYMQGFLIISVLSAHNILPLYMGCLSPFTASAWWFSRRGVLLVLIGDCLKGLGWSATRWFGGHKTWACRFWFFVLTIRIQSRDFFALFPGSLKVQAIFAAFNDWTESCSAEELFFMKWV